MATITLRIDDDMRDDLQRKAQEQGMTVSELVRDLILETTSSTRETTPARELDAPETLSVRDRHLLSLLHRILARVLPDDANDVDGDREYQLDRALVLERGYTAEYGIEFAGISPELSSRDCSRVMDILDMFRMVGYSLGELSAGGEQVSDDLVNVLRYKGLDFNDRLEGQMAHFVNYLLADGRWSELAEDIERTDRGNSHSPKLEVYLRMLTEYRKLMETRPPTSRWRAPLNLDQLKAIADAQVHPSNRPRRTVE